MKRAKREFGPAFAALMYALFGAAWILLSDAIAMRLIDDGLPLPLVQTLKGLFFVALTSALVYGLMRYSTRRLREERTRYREMADNVEDVFYNYDPVHDKLLYAGPAFERIWGRSLGEAYADPMSYLEGIHPDDRDAVHDADRKRRRGEATETEFRLVNPRGKTTWILDRSRSILGPQGHVERIVGTMRDVTGIKRAQEALAESRRQLSTLLDNLPGTAYRCLLDEAWTTLFISEGITPLTGYLPSDFLNSARLTYSDLIHPEDHDRIFRQIMDASACGQAFEVEYRIFSRDGTEKSVWERGRFFPGTEEQTGYLEGFILDVTDRKRAEAERQRIEERYRQSQKLEAIGRLAGGIAHDFNNLLTVILVRAEMAQRKVEPGDPVHAALREIYDAAQRSTGLARQLLTYARRQVVTTDALVLNPLVEAAVPMLQRLVGENILLDWTTEPELWPIEINPSQVDQVLINLCLNARDAMPHGGLIRLEAHNVLLDEEDCRRRPGLHPGEHVFLSVADTGTGMDQVTIERLFEPFFTTKEVGKGTGLGLPTVHGIVHQSRGIIEVDSSLGKGSVFRILLPHARASSAPPEAPAKSQRSAVGSDVMNAFPSGKGEPILIVDPDATLRKLGSDILTGLGYAVLEAESPEAALKVADKRNRDHQGSDIRLVMIDENEEGGLHAERLSTLLPLAGRLLMSESASPMQEAARNTASSIAGSALRTLVVRKPFATAELAIKVRDAIAEGR